MPDLRRARCRACGGHRDEVGPISWNGYCLKHGIERMRENNEQLAAMENPARDRWARGMILSAGGLLPDRLQTRS